MSEQRTALGVRFVYHVRIPVAEIELIDFRLCLYIIWHAQSRETSRSRVTSNRRRFRGVTLR